MIQSSHIGDKYIEEIQNNCLHALQCEGVSESIDIQVAEKIIRLLFLSRSLALKMSKAFVPILKSKNIVPDYSIFIWEGSPMVSPPRMLEVEGQVECPTFYLKGKNFRLTYDLMPTSLSLAVWDQNVGYFWMKDADDLPRDHLSCPLLELLSWIGEENSMQLVHAASIANADGGILVCGEDGSGKSSIASSALQNGLQYIADDFCMLPLNGPHRAFSIYNTIKIRKKSDMPEGLKPISQITMGKETPFILNVPEFFPGQAISECLLKAIVVLQPNEMSESSLKQVSIKTVLNILAPSTKLALRSSTERIVFSIYKVIKHLPAYMLSRGQNQEDVFPILLNLLSNS